MINQEIQEQIKKIISPEFEKHQLFLVDINLRGNTNSRVLTILTDTETGVGLDELTAITRSVEDILEVDDLIPGKYRLEISSPGIDYPLKEEWQYRKNIGRELHVSRQIDAEVLDITGRLVKIENDQITLQVKKEETTIPLAEIKNARVKAKW